MGPDEFYRLLGKFNVTFEEMCYHMECSVINFLERNGLDGYEKKYIINILLDSKTADPLQKMLRALWSNNADEKTKVYIGKLFKEISEMISLRNIIIHTKWVAPQDENTPEEWRRKYRGVLGHKIKANSHGDDTLYPRIVDGLVDTDPRSDDIMLSNLIEICEEINLKIGIVNMCSSNISRIENYFVIKEKKLLVRN